ncbi:MAG: hypothetical protein LUE22_00875 [Oscillospiraceae bacterium]|nr:hypothetical protein [Oscillospiraceae bacterium]
MIEKIVLDYLTDALDVPVYMEVPETPPQTYVVLEKTGGGQNNHISTATLAVQSCAPSLYEAALLNEQVKTAMDSIITLDSVSRIKLNSDYNFTDTATKKYRYQAVFDFTYY